MMQATEIRGLKPNDIDITLFTVKNDPTLGKCGIPTNKCQFKRYYRQRVPCKTKGSPCPGES